MNLFFKYEFMFTNYAIKNKLLNCIIFERISKLNTNLYLQIM